MGVQFGSTNIDETNQIEDDSQTICDKNCGKCLIDPSTLSPICSACLLPYTLTDQHTCKPEKGSNPAWFIVLIVLVVVGLGVGGFFFYRRYQRKRAMAVYNRL